MNRRFFMLALVLVPTMLLGAGCLSGKSPAKPAEQAPVSAEEAARQPDGKPVDSETSVPVEQVTQINLILDASGSMWGQVDGRAKIDVAKESMGKIIDELKTKKNLQVSLRIYAHLNKKCTNSVVEIPMGPIDAAAMKAKIQGITPLGSTPIAYSLTESVKDFKKDIPGEKIVILITDGLESCGGDPCAVAKALKEGGIVSQVHVVGFGLAQTELNTLQCIVKPFNGQVTGAANSTEFLKALQTILDKALEYNVELTGKTTKGQPVHMSVKVLQAGNVIKEDQGSHLTMMLPPGRYDIEAESIDGIMAAPIKNLEVKADEITKKDVVFVQGTLSVNVVGSDGKPLKARETCMYKIGTTDHPVKCAQEVDRYTFKLAPGLYDLYVQNSVTAEITWLKGIEIKADESSNRTVGFGEGTLKLTVTDNTGKAMQVRETCLYEAGTDTVAACTQWVDQYAFVVKPGLYDLSAQNGGTGEVKWIKGIEIKSIETVAKSIVFEQASLTVRFQKGGELFAAYETLVYKSGTETLVGSIYDNSELKLDLLPGSYDIRVKDGDSTEPAWIRGVELKAGDVITKVIDR